MKTILRVGLIALADTQVVNPAADKLFQKLGKWIQLLILFPQADKFGSGDLRCA